MNPEKPEESNSTLVEELDEKDLDKAAGGINNCQVFNNVAGCGCN